MAGNLKEFEIDSTYNAYFEAGKRLATSFHGYIFIIFLIILMVGGYPVSQQSSNNQQAISTNKQAEENKSLENAKKNEHANAEQFDSQVKHVDLPFLPFKVKLLHAIELLLVLASAALYRLYSLISYERMLELELVDLIRDLYPSEVPTIWSLRYPSLVAFSRHSRHQTGVIRYTGSSILAILVIASLFLHVTFAYYLVSAMTGFEWHTVLSILISSLVWLVGVIILFSIPKATS